MKRFVYFMFVCVLCGTSFATTVNYNWLVDGTNYAQTTCETGDDLILPTPTPTKYGYHFVGWRETTIYGSWSQSGTPTPENPISPVFKPFGNTVLRAVGSGNNFIADSYNPETRTITRRIGIKVLDGTENWAYNVMISNHYTYKLPNQYDASVAYMPVYCSHFNSTSATTDNTCKLQYKTFNIKYDTANGNVTTFKQWLADQYNAGTPVIIVYPLATPVEENLQ